MNTQTPSRMHFSILYFNNVPLLHIICIWFSRIRQWTTLHTKYAQTFYGGHLLKKTIVCTVQSILMRRKKQNIAEGWGTGPVAHGASSLEWKYLVLVVFVWHVACESPLLTLGCGWCWSEHRAGLGLGCLVSFLNYWACKIKPGWMEVLTSECGFKLTKSSSLKFRKSAQNTQKVA